MKSAIVPAQITTVEDKVVGNLSMQQMVLAVFPLFVGGGLFALAPSMFVIAMYKLVIFGVVALICLTAAIRIRGVLVIYIVARLCRFYTRPRIYVYRRSDTYLREKSEAIKRPVVDAKNVLQKAVSLRPMRQDDVRTMKLSNAVSDKARYTVKQGGLHVSFINEK